MKRRSPIYPFGGSWILAGSGAAGGWAVWLATMLGVFHGGCGVLRIPPELLAPTPTRPALSEAELRNHVQFFHGEIGGMLSGRVQEGSRLVPYVATYMREFRMQPAVGSSFESGYGVREAGGQDVSVPSLVEDLRVMGYVAGKHPVHRRDLIMLCVDIEANVGVEARMGIEASGQGDMDWNVGVAASAVLEVSRNLTFVTRRWPLPDRSVLVAVWTGSKAPPEGLRHFLKQPTWPLDRIRSVVYVGLDPDRVDGVRRLLSEFPIALTVIPMEEGPMEGGTGNPRERFGNPESPPGVREPGKASTEGAVPTPSMLLDDAVVRARRMAAAAYEKVIAMSTETSTFSRLGADALPPDRPTDTP